VGGRLGSHHMSGFVLTQHILRHFKVCVCVRVRVRVYVCARFMLLLFIYRLYKVLCIFLSSGAS